MKSARCGTDGLPRTPSLAPQIIPEGDAELSAGLTEAKEGMAAIAADVAVRSAADLALGHLASDIIFRPELRAR